MIDVRKISVSEFEAAENLGVLLAEYADESAIEGLPEPKARMEIYKHLEALGFLHCFGAFNGEDKMIGFIFVLMAHLPHYNSPVACSESFFVAKDSRFTGAGLKLLRAAEAKAAYLGSPGLIVSAPFNGDLFRVLPRLGYKESNRVYFKKVRVADV